MQEKRSLAQLINELTVLENLVRNKKVIAPDYANTIHEARQLVIALELLGIASQNTDPTNP